MEHKAHFLVSKEKTRPLIHLISSSNFLCDQLSTQTIYGQHLVQGMARKQNRKSSGSEEKVWIKKLSFALVITVSVDKRVKLQNCDTKLHVIMNPVLWVAERKWTLLLHDYGNVDMETGKFFLLQL